MCIKDAIPARWRNQLRNRKLMIISPSEETVFFKTKSGQIPIKILKSKQVYWCLNTKTIVIPTCKQKWHDKYGFHFTDTQWKRIFILARSLTSNTKLIEFQFKIIHRVYASNSYVSHFDNTVNRLCTVCNVSNNIIHQFAECNSLKTFWDQFIEWMTRVEGKNIQLDTASIIFGIFTGISNRLNFCILHAKWYIHLQKQSNQHVQYNQFMKYFNNVICIEHQLAVNRKCVIEFRNVLGVFHMITN